MADQQPIDDALLGKFLAGETDPAESARVQEWLANRASGALESGYDDFAKPDQRDAVWRTVKKKMRATDRNAVPRLIMKSLPARRSEQHLAWNPTIFRIATVLVLVAGMGWLTYRLRFYGQDHPAAQLVTLTTNEHQLSKTLPDGTRTLLSQHSTLRYPAVFADNQRTVTLTGEAFFNVTPDINRPFYIEARQCTVQVLGTSFTVRAYDANVSVAVQTGNVRFSGGRKTVLLTKNQQATFVASVDTIRRILDKERLLPKASEWYQFGKK